MREGRVKKRRQPRVRIIEDESGKAFLIRPTPPKEDCSYHLGLLPKKNYYDKYMHGNCNRVLSHFADEDTPNQKSDAGNAKLKNTAPNMAAIPCK